MSEEYEKDLEDNIKIMMKEKENLENTNLKLQVELDDLKYKYKIDKKKFEQQLRRLKEEKNKIELKSKRTIQKLTHLEIENES